MAGPEIHNLARIAVTEETAANFGLDLSGSATYEDVPFMEGTAQLTLTQALIDPQTAQQYKDGRATKRIGIKTAALTLTLPLYPTGTAADASTTAPSKTDSALFLMLSLSYGGIRTGQMGDVVNGAGSSASVFDATNIGRFAIGTAIGIAPGGAATGVEARIIEGISSSTITLKGDLTGTPSSSDIIYNSATIYPVEDQDSCFQFIIEGVDQANRWALISGQVTSPPTLSMNFGELPTISFTIEFASWERLANAAITPATYDGYSPIKSTGEFFAQVTGTSTKQILAVSDLTYQFNSPTYIKQMSPSGTNTVQRWVRARAVPFCEVSLTVPWFNTVPYEETWMTARDAGTNYNFVMQIGSTAGSIVVIEVPTAQITDAPAPSDSGGLSSHTIKAEAGLDTDTGAQTSELLRAPVRIHFL